MEDDDLLMHVPVKCPLCGSDRVMQFRVTHLRAAFDLRQPIRLQASCHDAAWEANAAEAQRVREYLVAWLDTRRRRM
jgi:hypothetical protein